NHPDDRESLRQRPATFSRPRDSHPCLCSPTGLAFTSPAEQPEQAPGESQCTHLENSAQSRTETTPCNECPSCDDIHLEVVDRCHPQCREFRHAGSHSCRWCMYPGTIPRRSRTCHRG